MINQHVIDTSFIGVGDTVDVKYPFGNEELKEVVITDTDMCSVLIEAGGRVWTYHEITKIHRERSRTDKSGCWKPVVIGADYALVATQAILKMMEK